MKTGDGFIFGAARRRNRAPRARRKAAPTGDVMRLSVGRELARALDDGSASKLAAYTEERA